jgi:hypothetical protein
MSSSFLRNRLISAQQSPGSLLGSVGASQDVMEFVGDSDSTGPKPQDESLIGGPIIVRKPCMLTKYEETESRQHQEDSVYGIHDDGYECEPCRVGNDDLTTETSEELANIYKIEKDNFLHIPDDKIADIMAKRYNNTIYRVDERLHRGNVKKWSKSIVRHHIQKCSRANPRRIIWKQIILLDDAVEHIKNHGMYEREYTRDEFGVETPTGDPELINHSHMKTLQGLVKTQMELLKLDLGIRQQDQKELAGQSATADKNYLTINQRGKSLYD